MTGKPLCFLWFGDQEDEIDQDAENGRKNNGRDTALEKGWDLEREQTIGEHQVAAYAADQDNRADRQLFRVEQVHLSDWIRAMPCIPMLPNR